MESALRPSRRTALTRVSRAGLAVLAAALIASACDYVHLPFLSKLDQPVVLTGADVPGAIGLDPARATLWRWDDGAWVQIPVQIDERHVVAFGSQPSNNAQVGVEGTVYGNGSGGPEALQYSDPATFVGPDPNPLFDGDDELVFLARDAGVAAPPGTARPAGTVNGTGRQIALSDVSGATGFVYLYYGTVGADPSAGKDYVTYDFSLNSGDYKTTYKRADGPNPEQSTVSTYAYDLGMVDRWMTTDLAIDGGVDILDGFKARFAFSTCGRSNATFADAEGAFVANIDGPVRAIRSYIGANSGPLTQETWTFYPERIEQTTDLRVHAIPGIMSFVDYSAAADGMVYANSEMGSATVSIDGDPTGDSVPSAIPDWEYVHGSQGGVSMATEITSTSSFSSSIEWVDDSTPAYTECWGDGEYHGVAAHKVTSGIPNTDPRSAPFENLQARRVIGVWGPNVGLSSWAPVWAASSLVDLDVSIATF